MWHYSVELKNCLIYCFDLLELIALHNDIPSSSSWAIEKSGPNKQLSNQHFDSMPTPAQRAAVVKILCDLIHPDHICKEKLAIQIIPNDENHLSP